MKCPICKEKLKSDYGKEIYDGWEVFSFNCDKCDLSITLDYNRYILSYKSKDVTK
jgi:hypothetical protein